MQPWTVERGTLWALELKNGLPPNLKAQAESTFHEFTVADSENLRVAMNLPTPEPVRERFVNGRRCFGFTVLDQIVSYGWVTKGRERVGELEREYNLEDTEAYIWDCRTLPAWRGLGYYTALLSCIIYELYDKEFKRIWIGASRLNQPSVRGIMNAGFNPVLNCTYRRYYRFTVLRLQKLPTALPSLISAAYRMMINDHERLIGNLAVGYLRWR